LSSTVELNNVLTTTDHLSHVTTNTYDALGELETVTDANTNTTTNHYDNLRRLTSVVDALNQTTSYAYDADDNRTSVTNPREGDALHLRRAQPPHGHDRPAQPCHDRHL
jgi:YD repeat-containing protein